jgi:hypothetical protein
MEEIKDVRLVLKYLWEYLPPGGLEFFFPRLIKSPCRNLVLKKASIGLWLIHAMGGFLPDSKEIVIDLDADWERYAKALKEVRGLKISSREEGFLWLCLHELGHSILGSSEEKANEYATEQFTQFKRSQS